MLYFVWRAYSCSVLLKLSILRVFVAEFYRCAVVVSRRFFLLSCDGCTINSITLPFMARADVLFARRASRANKTGGGPTSLVR